MSYRVEPAVFALLHHVNELSRGQEAVAWRHTGQQHNISNPISNQLMAQNNKIMTLTVVIEQRKQNVDLERRDKIGLLLAVHSRLGCAKELVCKAIACHE